ncbi:MetQ/NlpA family ABC transporter substrate-binding protein [Aciduricibacillus chroicocephali]|uniref:Lipoprotein n=1 Tax=Aciduricibacillus chroicocephali TaxID=3054939 RepID=A0ABY9KW96_9BACI|nr:MetQ/NlpA family ABC transporter substrate-binding protein [Bacillaceae bacterium 44XB]
MKKLYALLAALLVLTLAACGTSGDSDKKDEKKDKVIKIGASSTPHAEILKKAEPLLEKKGIKLDIKEYQDYVFPNDDLADGKLDANFFQHIPYLEDTVEKTGYDITSIGGIHIEPMGVYSKNIKSVKDIKDGTEVVLSRSVADHGRVLGLFESQGLIKLKDGVKKQKATVKDIVENKKKLKFSADVDAASLPEVYEKEGDTLVAINTNYAIQAGLKPTKDALFIEGSESPYVNVIAVQKKDKDNKDLKELVNVLHSKEIQDFIKEKYNGAVVPVDGK